eukprot:11225487-Lingulodinium_polyedra.AAC.1
MRSQLRACSIAAAPTGPRAARQTRATRQGLRPARRGDKNPVWGRGCRARRRNAGPPNCDHRTRNA